MGGINMAVQLSMTIHAACDAYGLVHYEFIPKGCTVNKQVCVKIIRHLWDAVRRKRLEKQARNSWFLLHDNTLHISL
jgi:hypothetical protein